MRLWLDDERPAPAGWVRCRWPDEVIAHLQRDPVVEISLDHDLGDDDRGTGYDVLAWLEVEVATRGRIPPTIHLHTANPAARDRMAAAVHSIGVLSASARALRDSYDTVASAYGDRISGELAGKPFDRDRLAEVVAAARGPLVDLGCGPGHVAAYLSGLGAEVVGIDLSPGMVAEARRRHPDLSFAVGDLRSPPGGPYGGAVAMYSLIHVPPDQHGDALAGIGAVLSPGAPLLVAAHLGDETVSLDTWWGHDVQVDFHCFDGDILADLVRGAEFHEVRVWERDPYPEVEHPSRRVYVYGIRR